LSRSKIAAALRRGDGSTTSSGELRIQLALRVEYLEAPPTIASAYETIARSHPALRLIDLHGRDHRARSDALGAF
jgi:hypothetical protein